MMADNVEHVITYWVLWQKFHSPTLVGFEVVSHWLPFLLLSIWFGSLAERYDCRRLIQGAQVLFMLVSVSWGILFATGSLQVWMACVLLVMHGMAGSMWSPAEQLMLHDFAGRRDLTSAIRLNATFKSLGVLLGPVVGSALLLGLGSTAGIFTNVLFYLPLTLFLFRTKFTGHTREAVVSRARLTMLDTLRVLGKVGSDRLLMSMMVLAALTAIFIGGALQTSMPVFANTLGAGSAGLAYGVLLFANGAGGVVGGFLLEATGVIKPNARAAVVTTALFGVTTLIFASTGSYLLAVVALVVGGVANIASTSIGQSIVQLEAPSAERGRVLGVYSMFSSGFRVVGGVSLGVFGALLGIGHLIALSAALLVVGALVTGVFVRAGHRRALSERVRPS
ncbi:MAG: transporter [Frondihabitans sp.]|nr:transporter [Frondihabitans sp.]